MQFNQPIFAPGEEVVLSLTAGPGSLCAYGVTDKSVLLLAGSNKVKMDSVSWCNSKLFRDLKTDIIQNNFK